MYRGLGGDRVPEYFAKPSPYTEGTAFLGTPANHDEVDTLVTRIRRMCLGLRLILLLAYSDAYFTAAAAAAAVVVLQQWCNMFKLVPPTHWQHNYPPAAAILGHMSFVACQP